MCKNVISYTGIGFALQYLTISWTPQKGEMQSSNNAWGWKCGGTLACACYTSGIEPENFKGCIFLQSDVWMWNGTYINKWPFNLYLFLYGNALQLNIPQQSGRGKAGELTHLNSVISDGINGNRKYFNKRGKKKKKGSKKTNKTTLS